MVVLVYAAVALSAACAGEPRSETPAAPSGDAGSETAQVRDAGQPGDAERSDAASVEPLLPARIRRLSNAEYNGSVAALLSTELAPARGFAPDARQAGFTVNEAQRVDSVLAKQLFAAAEQLAADARARFGKLAPCATPNDPEGCARSFIARFGARSYRRPLDQEEADGLLALFRAGALDASYEDGIELVIRALLQSGGFLYLTELGQSAPSEGSAIALTEYELASSLSYLMTGGPPDEPLLAAAALGTLSSPEVRRAELQRLRDEHPESRAQLVHTLREWLELDRIEVTAKDSAFYPTYEDYGPLFIAESRAFIGAVLDDSRPQSAASVARAADLRSRAQGRASTGALAASDLSSLLYADWTVGSAKLAQFYEAEDRGDGRLKLPTRRGILNQGAFLAVHAHAYESAPILRGAVIERRLACVSIPDPSTLGISVSAPPSDLHLTTRQRFDAHVADPSCAGCHKAIDSIGNTFELYDGMGGYRQMENDANVDAKTVIEMGKDFDGSYADSNALAEALANSPDVEECFARYLFRAAAARSADSRGGEANNESEDAFIAAWNALPTAERGNVVDTLSAFVSSRLFTHRRAQ